MSEFIIEFDENYECPCIKDGTDCGLNMILNCVGYYGNRNPECPLIKVVRLFAFEKEDTRWRIDQQ